MSEDFIPTTGNGAIHLLDVVTPFTGTVGTDFLTFGVGAGANVESQTDYQNDAQRPTGNLPGIARSNFNNKALRQGTFVAHSLCLWISQQIEEYVPDDGNDIAWIGSYSSALSHFFSGMFPTSPDLGAYLPLAGGTMSGHIYFNSGISTILSNNTWYYSKDSGGTSRGLILYAATNNIYINDGTAPYVFIAGNPTVNNGISWCGRDTSGAVWSVIGILSDNSVHVSGGQTGNIFLDCGTNASVWTTGHIVLNNTKYIYCKDTSNTARAVLGLSTGNDLMINSNGIGSCRLYAAGAGTAIYLHNYTWVLSTLSVVGYTYLQGGRAYIPGGNDPFQIYSDNSYYARCVFTVGNTRTWSVGVLSSGLFSISDETAVATRFAIDVGSGTIYGYSGLNISHDGWFGGSLTCTGNFNAGGSGIINNGLTVYNSINLASGTLLVSAGASISGGLQVWGGLIINSGDFSAPNNGYFGNQLHVQNLFQVNNGPSYFYGTTYVYDYLHVSSGIYVGGNGLYIGTDAYPLYDAGNNWIYYGGNFNLFQGDMYIAYLTVNHNAVIHESLYIYGNLTVLGSNTFYGSFTASGGINAYNIASSGWLNVTLQSDLGPWGGSYSTRVGRDLFAFGRIVAGDDANWTAYFSSPYTGNPISVFNTNTSFGTSTGAQVTVTIYRAFQVFTSGGYAARELYTYWDTISDGRFKDEIKPYETGLADILKLEPKRYRALSLTDRTPRGRAVGFIADEVEKIMPDMVFENDVEIPKSDPLNNKEDPSTIRVKMMNTSELQFAMLNAIKELASRIEKLESGR